MQLRSGSDNGYEIIFPSMIEEEKNAQYEIYIKKANDMWDEFTTGKSKKKPPSDIHTHPDPTKKKTERPKGKPSDSTQRESKTESKQAKSLGRNS